MMDFLTIKMPRLRRSKTDSVQACAPSLSSLAGSFWARDLPSPEWLGYFRALLWK